MPVHDINYNKRVHLSHVYVKSKYYNRLLALLIDSGVGISLIKYSLDYSCNHSIHRSW